MKRRLFIKNCVASSAVLATGMIPRVQLAGDETPSITPEWNKLPRWRGFNLTEKIFGDTPFKEEDFRNIHDLGFDFLRIGGRPWFWTDRSDNRKFNEKTLKDFDLALEYAKKYRLHVNLCFSYPPGHPAPPAREDKDRKIWTDLARRDLWAYHWSMFAKRYRDIPNEQLSFNLLNEPDPDNDLLDQYFATTKALTDAIRSESRDRLIICDGIDWGKFPYAPLAQLKVAQSTRGYTPSFLTHYKASWVQGADQWTEPVWPGNINGRIHKPDRNDIPEDSRQPLVFEGNFSLPVTVRARVVFVGTGATLAIVADGKELYRHEFKPGPGQGEWIRSKNVPNTKRYIADYKFDCVADVPAGTKRIEIRNVTKTGDHLLLGEVGFKTQGQESVYGCVSGWIEPSSVVPCSIEGNAVVVNYSAFRDADYLKKVCIDPWLQFQKETGSGVMVGEFGCFFATPHHVMLHWLEDYLKLWKDAGWGWAMWNYIGDMGIANSHRKDVVYENWRNLKIDRKLVDLLLKY